MRCRKVRKILQYHLPKKLLPPEKFAHYLMLLLFPFRDEKQLLSGCPPYIKTKFKNIRSSGCCKQEQNKVSTIWWFSWSGFFLEFNENLINNRDPHSPIENNETPGTQCPNESRSEEEHRKLLHFQISCYKYYQVMKLKKHKFLTFKAKEIFQCGSYLTQRLRKI